MKGIDNMESEIWKDIPGYEGLYMVSDKGRIKSYPRLYACGLINNKKAIKKSRILKFHKTNSGYLQVGLTKNRKQKQLLVHQLIYFAFSGFYSNRELQIDHINGIKTDNRLKNLQILCRRENTSKSVEKDGKMTGAFRNGNKWISRISVKNRIINIGNYNSQIEAHCAYIHYKNNL
jgi:hypothetical protein